jgi:Protein of Unknown function (DUF2784)
MLADAIVVAHSLIVIFIVGAVPLVYAGAALRWRWVRDWPWRLAHLAAILFVAGESLLGVPCPLTVWEDALRGQHPAGGFIERWTHRVMFYDAPAWVFTTAYVGFAGLVVATWIVVPPNRRKRA